MKGVSGLLLSVLTMSVGCNLYRPVEELPPLPSRPHTFSDLQHIDVPVALPGRDVPIRIHCKVMGEGPPLLLIHGLMTSSYSFRYLIPFLADRYRVIVPDLPGAGRSEAPRDLPMTPHSIADLLSALITALHLPPPYVVGNSLGGYESVWLALLHPEQVRKLVVIHAPGFPLFRLGLLQLILALPGGEALFQCIAARDPEGFAAANVHYHDSNIMSREEAREYGSIFRDHHRRAMFTRILRETLGALPMAEFRTRLIEIRDRGGSFPPTRLLWAREDEMVPPSFGPRYRELIPSAELVWFDRTSHFLQVEAPEQTAQEILRFDQ